MLSVLLFLKLDLFILLCVCVLLACVCVPHVSSVQKRSEEDIGSSGTGVMVMNLYWDSNQDVRKSVFLTLSHLPSPALGF